MPEGYYSGDKPNPNLRAFVEAHVKERPYDPATDTYDVPAFDHPIEATKATAIYNMHTYWSKKPHDAIREYVRHYTQPGDLVLDPFCGSGGTALAALMEGRKAIAIDRSPAATFISKNYCTPVDVAEFRSALSELRRKVEPEFDWLYATRCDRCGGLATTLYTVYSQVYQCPRCLRDVALFECTRVTRTQPGYKQHSLEACPFCYANGHTEEISPRLRRKGFTVVGVGYECVGLPGRATELPCKPRRGHRYRKSLNSSMAKEWAADLLKISEIEQRACPYEAPTQRMMNAPDGQKVWGLLWRPYHEGVESVQDFFTSRNLWALLALKNAVLEMEISVSARDFLMCGITAILLKCSRLMGYREDGVGRVMSGTYWIPQNIKDVNVWSYYTEWASDAERHLTEKNRALAGKAMSLMISTETATDLTELPSSSVDYVFTDPPYSWKVQYGESNFIWEAFLGLDTNWHEHEIIVNDHRQIDERTWARNMKQAFSEIYRVLRPSRWLSLCYHDSSEGTWQLVQDIMDEVGFVIDVGGSTLYIDTGQKSIKQITADKVTKRDLVLNFRKPKPGESDARIVLTGTEDAMTFADKVRAIIRDYLTVHPGETKDRIYDEVASRMVRAGQMEAHDFDELLGQVAEAVREPVKKNLFDDKPPDFFGSHEMVRWYLKETETAVVDAAESAKEDRAAGVIQARIADELAKHPASGGVHYSDVFEAYLGIKDRPRRPLDEWLSDYFYQTDGGLYRLPASDEEERLKADGRSQGTSRRIKRYLSFLQHGVAVPEHERPSDATLVAWLRHCRRSSLYEQGKHLYETGGLNLDRLSEQDQVDVEEDYQVCVRALDRAAAGQRPESGGKRAIRERRASSQQAMFPGVDEGGTAKL